MQKHIAVLEAAEMVTKRRSGREQLVTANIETLRNANQLLAQFEQLWTERINRMANILAEPNSGASK